MENKPEKEQPKEKEIFKIEKIDLSRNGNHINFTFDEDKMICAPITWVQQVLYRKFGGNLK